MIMFLKFFSYLIIINFLQICGGKHLNPSSHLVAYDLPHETPNEERNRCPPSACGNIRNISYPFRLRDDPKHCGDIFYELVCESNITTSIYLDSQKYFVQSINYHNYTIRLTYPAIKTNDSCSFPKYSPSLDIFEGGFPYSVISHKGGRYKRDRPDITRSITFMSCPSYVVNNNSLLLETIGARCFNESDGRRRTYVKFGHLNGSYIMNMCRIEVMAMTSLPLKEGNGSVSLSEIHSSLLYGFELSWFSMNCDISCQNCWLHGTMAECYPPFCNSRHGYPRLLCGNRVLSWIDIVVEAILQYGIALNLTLRIVIGMPCMLGLLIYKLKGRRKVSMFEVIEGFLQSNNYLMPIRYSYSNIKKMTKGFRENLGEGGYGSVYKGKLRSGSDVAVKVLSKPRANGQDFINEVATIGRIHHVNVVKLVGYCAERSKRALVYDFMPNGSLEKYIFTKERTCLLSWERKYDIAVGVARGIEYLHRGCDIQILHFDIKPHNILLDDNFTPKISDFGLAKLYSKEKAVVTLTAARGTIGYVAPELINRGIGAVSYKADVYSFGMLLMEMVGLKRDMAADDDESSRYFPYWICDRFNKGKDIEMGNVDEKDEHARKTARKMAIVGLWCIQMRPDDRPSMNEVLKMLEGEDEALQIPPQPSVSPQNIIHNCDSIQTWETESTESIALMSGE